MINNQTQELNVPDSFMALPEGWDNVKEISKSGPSSNVSFFGELLSLHYKDKLVFNSRTKSWWLYDDIANVYQLADEGSLYKIVSELCFKFYETKVNVTPNAVQDILKVSKSVLTEDLTSTVNGIPFKNGLLKDGILESHSPANKLTYCLPFDYEPDAQCPLFLDWLKNSLVYEDDLSIIRAFMNVLLNGNGAKYHKGLMLVGEPRTGKGVTARIFTALVGLVNTAEISLQRLESSNFEATKLYGKPLAIINEVGKHNKLVNKLQNVIGGDPLNYEVKNQQAGEAFVYKGIVLITGNRLINTSDETRAIDYRIFYVTFKDRDLTTSNRTLLEYEDGNKPYGEFASELSGIANWALSMSPDDAHSLLNVIKPSQKSTVLALAEQDPVVGFMHECFVVNPDCSIEFKKIYEAYTLFCGETGSSPMAKNSLGRKIRTLQKTLNLPFDVLKKSGNKTYIQGIQLLYLNGYSCTRKDDDLSPIETVL